ncbi:hypothetical protein BDR22DRAFT_815990, partial [Usnea florida]
LAQIWAVVLLINGADVLIAKRTATEIERNASVSSSFRTLSCYQGIIILTTNRHGKPEKAFASHIHVSIHYDVPNTQQRIPIWSNSFDK